MRGCVDRLLIWWAGWVVTALAAGGPRGMAKNIALVLRCCWAHVPSPLLRIKRSFNKHQLCIASLPSHIGSSGSMLVSAGGNQLCVWDLVGGGRRLRRLANFQKTVTCVKMSPMAGPESSAAPRMLAGSLDGHVKVRPVRSRPEVAMMVVAAARVFTHVQLPALCNHQPCVMTHDHCCSHGRVGGPLMACMLWCCIWLRRSSSWTPSR